MGSTDDLLASFVFEPGLNWWQADVAVPLWGGPLPVSINAPASGPSPRQAATLRAVLAYPRSLREAVGQALLSHYNDDWGCCTPSLGHAPPLASVDDVWPAMSGMGLHIPAFRSEVGGAVFELHMDSEWDEDHGLCVLVKDWAVIRVAGQTDCRGGDA